MTTTDHAAAAATRRQRVDRRDPALWVRMAVVALGVVFVVAVPTSGARETSYGALERAIARGDVERVSVSPALPAGANGFVVQDVEWRDGWTTRRAHVLLATRGTDTRDAPTTTRTVRSDVATTLRQEHPGLRVVRSGEPAYDDHVRGWEIPGWLSWFGLVLALLSFGLIVAGPQPWRATRWAWFWLIWSPIGFAAFVVLAGPFPLVRRPDPARRRLTGGWAFLLGLVLSAVRPWS